MVMKPEVAGNVAAPDPAATVTAAGTVRALAMPPLIETEAPPVAAALLRVMVQVVLLLEVREATAHFSDETSTGATRESEAVAEAPFREAVMVAF